MAKQKANAISPTRVEDYPEWYQQVVKAADMAEVSPVRGCMIIKPWGYGIWERVQAALDKRIKDTGHENAYFPLLIPLSYLEKEAKHVDGFAKDDTISEPRVMRFPEYTDVVFQLTKTMDFEIIPTAGWTRIMANERSAKLRAISEDPERVDDWNAYTKARTESDSTYRATGKVNDPYFIHTAAYDDIQDIFLQEYNRLFNIELALGGWENINIAHYWNIEKALEKHRYQGKRMLIIYGAGHKGWFLRQLEKRDDIIILDMKPFLDAIQ